MLQRDWNTQLTDHGEHDVHFVYAWGPDFRRKVQAQAAEEQWKALGLAFRATGRLVRRVIGAIVDFWNIPILGPSNTQRS